MSNVSNFTSKDMSDLLYDILSLVEDTKGTQTEAVLTQPSTESVFPCRVIDTPLENINLSDTNSGVSLRKTFQASIEHWAEKQRFCMEMASNTDSVLQTKNFVRTSSSPILYDEITKKYKFISTYEVRWEALTNSFTLIR